MAAGLVLGRRRGDDRERAHRLVRARRRRTARCCRSRSSCSSSRCGPSWKPSRSSSDGARRPHRRRARRGGPRRARGVDAPAHGAAVALVVLAALVPAVAPSWVHVDSMANGFYLALAATGLWLTVGARRDAVARAGRVHGDRRVHRRAAHGEGRLAGASRRRSSACSPRPRGGVLAGAGVVRLRPVFIAVTTWILTWAVTIFLLAFRSVSGGAQGLVVAVGHLGDGALRARPRAARRRRARRRVARARRAGDRASRRAAGAGRLLRRSASRPRGAGSARSSPRRRSAVWPAGSRCSSQASRTRASTGRTSRSSSSSRCCSAASRRRSGRPPASPGSALVTGAAGVLGSLEGVESARFDPMLAALLLLAVLALGGEGIVPLVRARLVERRREQRRRGGRRRSSPLPPSAARAPGRRSSSPSR